MPQDQAVKEARGGWARDAHAQPVVLDLPRVGISRMLPNGEGPVFARLVTHVVRDALDIK